MFYIDSFNRNEDISFEEAKRIIMGGRKDVSLLDAMKQIEARLIQERNIADRNDEMSEFYYDWHYEINAFNKVFSDMSKLFAPA